MLGMTIGGFGEALTPINQTIRIKLVVFTDRDIVWCGICGGEVEVMGIQTYLLYPKERLRICPCCSWIAYQFNRGDR